MIREVHEDPQHSSNNDVQSNGFVPASNISQRGLQVLDQAAAELTTQFNNSGLQHAETKAKAFVDKYCADLDDDDLARIGARGLKQTVSEHYSAGYVRAPGAVVVKFQNVAQAGGGYIGHLDVVVDDMPFVVSSVMGALDSLGLGVLGMTHPTFQVLRDAGGKIAQIVSSGAGHEDSVTLNTTAIPTITDLPVTESWVHVDVTPADDAVVQLVAPRIRAALADVKRAFNDWKPMLGQMHAASEHLRAQHQSQQDEAAALLEWLADNHFTLLGFEERDLVTTSGITAMVTVPGSALGVLADGDRSPEELPDYEVELAKNGEPIIITKEAQRSAVHRDVYYDELLIKRYDAAGVPNGEYHFLGLFAASVYSSSLTTIPYLSRKVESVLEMVGYPADSYNGRSIINTLETYPREELFQDSEHNLAETVRQILHLEGYRRTKLFLRTDRFRRFVTAIVYLPRDVFSTAVRVKITQILQQATGATDVTHESRMSDSPLARLYFVLTLPDPQNQAEVDADALQEQVQGASIAWSDSLREALGPELGYEIATQLASDWAHGFPHAYRDAYSVTTAARDLRLLLSVIDRGRERVLTGALPIVGSPQGAMSKVPAVLGPIAQARRSGMIVETVIPNGHETSGQAVDLRLKLYQGAPLALADILPVFASLGLEIIDERLFEITHDNDRGFIYDFGLRANGVELNSKTLERLREVFAAAHLGWVESDPFNRIVLEAGASWREAEILRAYVRYLRQLTVLSYSATFGAETLSAHPHISNLLLQRFRNKFDPDLNASSSERDRNDAQLAAQLEESYVEAKGLDADTVLRRLSNAIAATERTNAFQLDELQRWRSPLAFKISPRKIVGAPHPVPVHEIWVYSPQVEGVHLRFGDVARGGLRWSDRREDFRTEVLGLVKAQIVKNAVIVPGGAKGGFFAKQLPPATDRDAWMSAGKQAYRAFIGALLDVTDNQRHTKSQVTIIPPERVVRYDADDSYLVVAADKGTASFSDIANEIAINRGFWLGDAFASGGSHGYDHKAMGITARGAWVSVSRHFQELGIDVSSEPFTVVGIGDMSGDVFGNGLLRSQQTRLVAAFDHRHIFLDPTPDAGRTFIERRRLFDLPRSSWADFDSSLISAGGGVYARTEKSIKITPEVANVLGIADKAGESVTPTELISIVLKAPVDLLYNGGIGTYVKATRESNAEVGDKQNDAIRVNGAELRVRVIGEGGNLGFTQAGRIEAAQQGILNNTDAIDNSAGVDTSDHEVNIKIAVDQLGLLPEQRNELLTSMTDEIGTSVLNDNYEQNRVLSVDRHSILLMPGIRRQITSLEESGYIDRALEVLPSDEVLEARSQRDEGLTQPELSVVLSYAKISLTEQLLSSNIFEDEWYERWLRRYFPDTLVSKNPAVIKHHPLAHEIIATSVANHFIDRAGISFPFTQGEETNATIGQITRAWSIVTKVFAVDEFYDEVRALDNIVPTEIQRQLIVRMRRMLTRAVRWFIEHDTRSVGEAIERFSQVTDAIAELPNIASATANPNSEREIAELVENGVPLEMARAHTVRLNEHPLLDVVDLARDVSLTMPWVARLYEAISDRYLIHTLLYRITDLPKLDIWQGQSRAALRDDLYAAARDITESLIGRAQRSGDRDIPALISGWEQELGDRMDRVRAVLKGTTDNQVDHDVAPIVVALRALRTLG